MIRFSRFKTIAAASIAITAGAFALSSAAAADDFRIDDAWKATLPDSDGVLTEKQQGLVNVIAYSSAAALLCDGIDIDDEKVAKATTGILAAGPKDLDDEEELARYTHIVMIMGTAKGIILAEGALHKDDFCANAAKEKADTQAVSFWK